MIVWVASFPRSGNTFVRILLNRAYGIATSTVYDVDGVAERVGRSLVGYTDLPAAIADMRADDQLHFVKTHSARNNAISPHDRALCIVRDGRDALVSWAHLRSQSTGRSVNEELRRIITEPRDRGPGFWDSGSWGTNVLSWIAQPAFGCAVILFDQLIIDPMPVLAHAMNTVAPEHSAADTSAVPTFQELQRIDPGFFRRGDIGAHLTELPPDLEAAFWSRTDNQLAMVEVDRLR